jgi:hypothetical protein
VLVLTWTCPLPFGVTPLAKVVPVELSMMVTVPVVTGFPPLVTVAVKVPALPA